MTIDADAARDEMADQPWRGMSGDDVYDVYTQDEYWVDATGRKHLLATMHPRYLRNLRKFLLRQIPGQAMMLPMRMGIANIPTMGASGWETGLEAEFDDLIRETGDWIEHPEHTPIYRGVVAELARRKHRRRRLASSH
jgi:hypothetical protein